MTQYSYAQLEGLWIKAGGDPSKAAIMAAIAEAESGGNSQATNHNSNGTTDEGLWQINSVWPQYQTYDPALNAKGAVAIEKSQGLSAWSTYNSGAYKSHMSGNTTPNTNVPSGGSGGGSGGSGGSAGTVGAVKDTTNCLVGFSILGSDVCFMKRSWLRAIMGGGLILVGGAVGLIGVVQLMKATGAGKLIPPTPVSQGAFGRQGAKPVRVGNEAPSGAPLEAVADVEGTSREPAITRKMGTKKQEPKLIDVNRPVEIGPDKPKPQRTGGRRPSKGKPMFLPEGDVSGYGGLTLKEAVKVASKV